MISDFTIERVMRETGLDRMQATNEARRQHHARRGARFPFNLSGPNDGAIGALVAMAREEGLA